MDEYGDQVEQWTDVASFWVKPKPMSWREWVESGQVHGEEMIRYETRYRTDLDAEQELVIGDDRYNIMAVYDPDGRRRMTQIDCRRHVD